ncbi:MAG: twin-arginine translocase subunit TatC [Verrucomicrobia bacterium]|nr:twin-arginine translocase subunit TatC [Verrucomicrobiota bacterium]
MDNDNGCRDEPKPFLEHLEELRWALLGCLIALALGMAVAAPLAPVILKWLRAPLDGIIAHPNQFLQSLEITGGFSIALQTTFWCGLLLSAPVILLLIGRFIFPGLRRRERKAISIALSFALFLFAFGVALGYFIVLPVALRVMLGLHQWMGIQAWWTITSYVAFTVQLLIAFGLAFELPMVLMVLGYLGIVSSAMLRAKRPHAIVILLILAMILTPGPDIFSQVVMAVPLILLYEFCIWSIRLFERKRRAVAGDDPLNPGP